MGLRISKYYCCMSSSPVLLLVSLIFGTAIPIVQHFNEML